MASAVDVPATIQEDDEVVAKSFLALSFISQERKRKNVNISQERNCFTEWTSSMFSPSKKKMNIQTTFPGNFWRSGTSLSSTYRKTLFINSL
uniref:Uncharacterized protein n=1 Tax=Brassica campestris TaxID=3711 RepID=M4DX60_BRACM